MNIKNKILLITGASSDVGRALIRETAEEYDWIWVHYNRSMDRVMELKEIYGDKILPIQADFALEKDVRNMIDIIIKSEILPNHIVHLSAPKTFNCKFHKGKWEDYQDGIDTSLRSIVLLLEAFLPGMIKVRYGRIVFMLTSYLVGVPPKYQSPYITIKYALFGLMKNLAAEYAEKGITVNGVSPDMIETRFLDKIPELVIQQNAERNPQKRNLTVQDVIPAFSYLLSESSGMVTGQNIGITGGG